MGNGNAGMGLERLTGSWNVEITTAEHGGGPGLLTFTSDGIVLGDESPMPFETAAHGNWIATGPGQAAYTFVAFVGNAEMKPPSRLKVVGELTLNAGADTWHGPFKIEMVDADGQQLLADRGTMSATRIVVERLT